MKKLFRFCCTSRSRSPRRLAEGSRSLVGQTGDLIAECQITPVNTKEILIVTRLSRRNPAADLDEMAAKALGADTAERLAIKEGALMDGTEGSAAVGDCDSL